MDIETGYGPRKPDGNKPTNQLVYGLRITREQLIVVEEHEKLIVDDPNQNLHHL